MRIIQFQHISLRTSNAARNLFLMALFIILASASSWAQTTDSTSYSSIHYKGRALVSANEEFRSCQFNLVNVVDSFLYIQINVAGLEIGRALATPVNILLINKIEKKYYEGDYSFFQKLIGFDVDFYAIQAIFNGFPFSLPEGVAISYQGENISDGFTFFKTFTGEYENYALELEVKKVTFNEVPEVSATVPKNYAAINFFNEE